MGQEFITIHDIEEALVQCHDLWRRSPGDGRWPFAGDGPWYLAQAEVGDIGGEFSETLVETESGQQLQVRKVEAVRPRVALDAAEVDRRDGVTAWLQLLPGEPERRMVWAATECLHRGETRVPWKALAGWLGWERTPRAMEMAYRRHLATLLCRVNGWPVRRARALAEAHRRREDA